MQFGQILKNNCDETEKTIYTYAPTDEKITNVELYKYSASIASYLKGIIGRRNKVLILVDSTFEFIQLFIATLFSGNIPIAYRRPNKKNINIINKLIKLSNIKFVISDEIYENVHDTKVIKSDSILNQKHSDKKYIYEESSSDIAYIQYSSGSTNDPKGVLISYHNMLESIKNICSHGKSIYEEYEGKGKNQFTSCSWLPHYHDMGLVGGILAPLYGNVTCHLMHPNEFIKDPYNWLNKISRTKANYSAAPNFAYEYCLSKISDEQVKTLDLSSWYIAYNGAEAVSLDTMVSFQEKFSAANFNMNTFFPCYGLAEYTLLATIRPNLEINKKLKFIQNEVDYRGSLAVSCGKAVHENGLAILDFDDDKKLRADFLGEIGLKGDSLFQGYDLKEENIFYNKMSDLGYYRTGDVGFVDVNNELYIVGRLDDRLSFRGKNLFPNELESNICKKLKVNKSMLLKIDEELVLVVESRRDIDFTKAASEIFKIVVNDIHVSVAKIIFVRNNYLLRTSSGKLRRKAIAEQIKHNNLKSLKTCFPSISHAMEVPDKSCNFSSWLKKWLEMKTGCGYFHGMEKSTFSDFGLDSLSAVILLHDINYVYGIDVDITALWEYPTPAEFINYVDDCILKVA